MTRAGRLLRRMAGAPWRLLRRLTRRAAPSQAQAEILASVRFPCC